MENDNNILSNSYYNLMKIADEKKEYSNASPFPNIVLDNFFQIIF